MAFTGGTGDILPQQLTLTTGTAGAVAEYITAKISLPVPRIGTSRGDRATVFELLWVDWYLGIADGADKSNFQAGYLSTAAIRASGVTSTRATIQTDLEDPRVFAAATSDTILTTSGAVVNVSPIRINLTDMNGNGFLVATDSINITGANAGGTTASSYVAKIGYRLVNVGTMEYVGIVQSQIS